MGKQTNLVPNHENFQRINYLFQAAHTVLRDNPGNVELIRFYCLTLKTIARKNVLRLDPHLKRSLCRKCYMLLIPGITSKVRIKGKRQSHSIVTCLECHTIKRFVVNAKHKLWVESPDAWDGQVPRNIADGQVKQNEEVENCKPNQVKLNQQAKNSKQNQVKPNKQAENCNQNQVKPNEVTGKNKHMKTNDQLKIDPKEISKQAERNCALDDTKVHTVNNIGGITNDKNINNGSALSSAAVKCKSGATSEATNNESVSISNELSDQMAVFMDKISKGEDVTTTARTGKCPNCEMSDMRIRIPKKGFNTKNAKKGSSKCFCKELEKKASDSAGASSSAAESTAPAVVVVNGEGSGEGTICDNTLPACDMTVPSTVVDSDDVEVCDMDICV